MSENLSEPAGMSEKLSELAPRAGARTRASAIDLMRDVPEAAVRIALGARTVPADDGVRLLLDERSVTVSEAVFDAAVPIARALQVAGADIDCASQILEMRHRAEDLYLSDVMGRRDVPSALFVPAGDLAGSWYRALLPAATLTDRGTAVANHTFRLDIGKALRHDVLWIQLISAPGLRRIVESAKAQGVKVVYDVDDNWEAIPDDVAASAEYREWLAENIWAMVDLADIVTVSTRNLERFVLDRKPECKVRVLSNMVPASWWPQRQHPDPALFRVLWAGSPTHRRDLAVVAPHLAEFLRRNAAARFVCFGENVPPELLPWSGQVERIPFVDFQEWPQALAGVGADIVIAPLATDDFNAGKSALRVVEAGACGYPIACSPVGEYAEVAAEGAPIQLVYDGQWLDVLEGGKDGKGWLAGNGLALRDWVRENRCMVRAAARPWLEVIEDAIGKGRGRA